MAFNLTNLVKEAESVVNEATSITDLAVKWANQIRPLLSEIPTVGPDVQVVVDALVAFDKVLHEVQSALKSV
jgi:hypothetical protein